MADIDDQGYAYDVTWRVRMRAESLVEPQSAPAVSQMEKLALNRSVESFRDTAAPVSKATGRAQHDEQIAWSQNLG